MQKDIHLHPPLVLAGRSEQLANDEEAIASAANPRDNSLAVYLGPMTGVNPSTSAHEGDKLPMYFVSTDSIPANERREFVTESLIIFQALHQMVAESILGHASWIRNNDIFAKIRKLAIDYVNYAELYTNQSSQLSTVTIRPAKPQKPPVHYASLNSCFALFVIRFLPEPDYEDAPIGEDLMEWLNIHFTEPRTEDGDRLSELEAPWEDTEFWPYLTRTIIRGLTKASLFFLKSLLQHDSEHLRDLTRALMSIVDRQPRLSNSASVPQYLTSMKRMRENAGALRSEMDRVPHDQREDATDNWWDRLNDIVGILEGRPEVLLRVCEELDGDWKEACAAWGVFVEPNLKREGLREVAEDILRDMPADSTLLEDMVHSALFLQEPDDILRYAAELDPWLAAHLADLMEAADLLSKEVNTESELTKRDYYVLAYAEYLHSDSNLWQTTVGYLYSCGEIGKMRGDEILMRIPLRLDEQKDMPVGQAAEGSTLQKINQTCFDYQRENVRRTVCRVASRTLMEERAYDKAVYFALSSEDWPALGRIADHVLDEFLNEGPRVLERSAGDMVAAISSLGSYDGEEIFKQRLFFLVRYAEFHALLREKEQRAAALDLVELLRSTTPKAWWAVLLCDAVPLLQSGPIPLFPREDATVLLRMLDEITTRAHQGFGEDYLLVLMRKIKGNSEQSALEHLMSVRLALARYFARCP